MTTFAELGVSPDLADALTRLGLTTPTAVQAASVPAALEGRDVAAQAPTGSGKTLAFGLPVLARSGHGTPRRPSTLILSPTRELATQIMDALTPLAGRDGLRFTAIFGGVGARPQIQALRRGVDVVVGCPGRLEDLIAQGALDLSQVSIAVVDEADRMADVGFLPAVKRLLDGTRRDRQTLLFSATLGGPVGSLIQRYQNDPVRSEIATAPGKPNNARHLGVAVEQSDRTATTAEAIRATGTAIVFCRTRHRADRVARQLDRQGIKAAAIHGGRSQGQRTRALDGLHAGRIQALVATDVAARGIHVDDLSCVVHYDPPGDPETYVHRSGRTGRAGAGGVVLNLVDHGDLGRRGELRNSPAPRDLRIEMVRAEGLGTTLARVLTTTHDVPEPEPTMSNGDDSVDGELVGVIKFFHRRRGFGFISADGTEDVFVHQSQLVEADGRVPREGDRVRFVVGSGPKGPQAMNVELLEARVPVSVG